MSGINKIFSCFTYINITYVVIFFIYIYIYKHIHVLEKHWWTLVLSWPDELEKVGQPEKNVLKRKYKTTDDLLNFCIYISYDCFDILSCLCVYIGI